MRDKKTWYKQGIVAIIPSYIKMSGDSTKILTDDLGEHYELKNIRSVINALAKKQLLDLKECKKYYGSKLGCKNLVPIPLNKETILIPVKTRKTLNKNDGAFAYVNLKHIEEILEDEENAIVILKDQREILSTQKKASIEKHIRNGRLIEEILKLGDGSRELICEDDFYNQYNSPATRADIIALRNDIMYIKSKLNT